MKKTKDIKLNNFTFTYTIEDDEDYEYSKEAILRLNIGHAYRPLLDACDRYDNNKSVTTFLLTIFIGSLGEKGDSNKRGARFLDEYGEDIGIVEYVERLFGKLPKTHDKEIIKRREEIHRYFLKVHKTLVSAGWKENTIFDKEAINNFEKIIINYSVN
jgi:hypothetical protein